MASEAESAVGSGAASEGGAVGSGAESAVGSGSDDPHARYRIDPHNYLVIEENGGYSVSYTPKEIPEDVVVEADPVDRCPKGIRRFRVRKYGMNTFDLVSVGTITIQNGFAYIAGMYINEEEPDRSNEFAYIPPFVITCPIQLPTDHLDEFVKEVTIKVHKDLKEQVAKYCLCTPSSILNIDLTRPHKLSQQNLCRRCGDKLYTGGFDICYICAQEILANESDVSSSINHEGRGGDKVETHKASMDTDVEEDDHGLGKKRVRLDLVK